MRETRSICCYCGVGCGVIIQSDGERISGVRGDPDHPVNAGRLCSKGATLHLTTAADGRLLYPALRPQRGAVPQRVSWDAALDTLAERFAAIVQQHGPDAVGFYLSGQLLTEDYYAFNKLVRGLIGSNNVDSNSRLCMSSAVAGYKATLGTDAPPGCYADIEQAGCILIVGSNTAHAHPVLFRRVEQARQRNPQQKLIVVDPRRTDTASSADLHLAVRPGTDIVLLNALLQVVLRDGLLDEDFVAKHTDGFAALHQQVYATPLAYAAAQCGLAEADIVQAAHWFARGPSLSLYCQGLNQSQSGTHNNAALINLHLATGKIGQPGAAPLSLTGQPNAMGGREVGAMANLLAGHRDWQNPAHRAEVAALWGVADLPAQPGLTAVPMFDALRAGKLKAVWIVCTNPVHSLPDSAVVRAALQQAELVVVQDAFASSDTLEYADVWLPASTWGEKSGTQTNSERGIARVRAAVPAPGEARPDWAIAQAFAQRLAARLGVACPLNFADEEDIFNEHRASTVGRDLDIGGLSYAVLEAAPQQWPYPAAATAGQARLYADGRFPTASGRAQFVLPQASPSPVTAEFPLHLNSGRLRDQWHGMSRSGRVPKLFNHVGEPLLSLSPDDMAARGLRDGDVAEVRSAAGQLKVRVQSEADCPPGQVFLPMHWGPRWMNGAGVNAVTAAVCDPFSAQPALKQAAVQVRKCDLPWPLLVLCRDATLQPALQAWLARCDYATLGWYGGPQQAVLVLRADLAAAPSADWLAELDALLDLSTSDLHYRDVASGVDKRLRLRDGQLDCLRLGGEIAAGSWLKEWLGQGRDVQAERRWLLSPQREPPGQTPTRGRIVCTCLDVAENDIQQQLARGGGVPALQQTLRCGTQCGSCVPELKRIAAHFEEQHR